REDDAQRDERHHADYRPRHPREHDGLPGMGAGRRKRPYVIGHVVHEERAERHGEHRSGRDREEREGCGVEGVLGQKGADVSLATLAGPDEIEHLRAIALAAEEQTRGIGGGEARDQRRAHAERGRPDQHPPDGFSRSALLQRRNHERKPRGDVEERNQQRNPDREGSEIRQGSSGDDGGRRDRAVQPAHREDYTPAVKRRLALLACAFLLPGCVDTSIVLHVSPDGHGRAVMTTRMYEAGLRAFDGLFNASPKTTPIDQELPTPSESELSLDLDLDKIVDGLDEEKARRAMTQGSMQEVLWQLGDMPGAVVPTD